MLLAAQVLIYLDVIVALRGIFFVCRDNFGGLRNDGLQCSCRRSPRAHLQGDVVPHGAAGRSTGSVGGAERGGGGCAGGGGSFRVNEEMPGGWIIVKFIVSALTLYDCECQSLITALLLVIALLCDWPIFRGKQCWTQLHHAELIYVSVK